MVQFLNQKASLTNVFMIVFMFDDGDKRRSDSGLCGATFDILYVLVYRLGSEIRGHEEMEAVHIIQSPWRLEIFNEDKDNVSQHQQHRRDHRRQLQMARRDAAFTIQLGNGSEAVLGRHKIRHRLYSSAGLYSSACTV
ncbi:hypothetical protein Trydic_g12546 [Trypoxylus dichotomus]